MAKSLRLSDDALQELLALMGQADSVELKLTLPESDRQHAMTALGVDPLDAHIRQVYFFDTPDLTLYKHGVVVRGRRSQDRPDDSVMPYGVPSPTKRAGRDRSNTSEPDSFLCSHVVSPGRPESLKLRTVRLTV
jgi:hypothetical protein